MSERREQNPEAKYLQGLLTAKDQRFRKWQAQKRDIRRHDCSDYREHSKKREEPKQRQVVLADRPQFLQKNAGKRVPDPVDCPAKFDKRARHNHDGCRREDGAFKAPPPAASQAVKAECGPCDEQELPRQRVEIPYVTLRIGRY